LVSRDPALAHLLSEMPDDTTGADVDGQKGGTS